MDSIANCVAGRDVYATLQTGDMIRGKFVLEKDGVVVLDDIFILNTLSKAGKKKFHIDSFASFFPVLSHKEEKKEEPKRDVIDFTSTKDRKNCFMNEMQEIVTQFFMGNFSFEDESEAGMVSNMLLMMVENSSLVEKILEGSKA